MQTAYVVTGKVTDARTIELDELLSTGRVKVRVIVEVLPEPRRSHEEVMSEIREGQRLRGHKPRTREEVDAALQAERDSWDEE